MTHDVCHNGTIVGRIIYDSKAHARWSNKFTKKLYQDLIQQKADHAILSSTVFPAGTNQLHAQDGVIIAHPARVIVLATLLRRQIIVTAVHRIGDNARTERRDRLYQFITSERCAQLLSRVASLSDDLASLDDRERSSHLTVWNKRSDLIKGLQNAQNEFTTAIDDIVGGVDTEVSP